MLRRNDYKSRENWDVENSKLESRLVFRFPEMQGAGHVMVATPGMTRTFGPTTSLNLFHLRSSVTEMPMPAVPVVVFPKV